MKFTNFSLKASVAALAVSLAATATPALADHHMEAAGDAAATEFPLTPEGAAQFIAKVEQEYRDFAEPAARIEWLNATYINYDSNTLASKYGAELSVMSVNFANEAAKYAAVEGLDPDVERKLGMLR